MQILNVYKSRNDIGQQFGWKLCYCDFGCVSVLICSPWAVCPNWFKIPSSDEIPNSLLLSFVCLSSAILLHTHILFFCFYATDSNTVIVLGDFYSKAEGYAGFLFSAQDANRGKHAKWTTAVHGPHKENVIVLINRFTSVIAESSFTCIY